MSQYQAIKAATNAYIKTNGRQEITGAILNAVMIATIDSLGRFYQFVGNAVPNTDPGSIDQNVAYIAGTPGTYTKLGGFEIEEGEVAVLKFDGEWKKEVLIVIPTKVSELINNSGYITNAVADLINYYNKEEVYTKVDIATILASYYDKGEVDAIIDAMSRQSYIVSWDGTAEPIVANIPLGVSVTWNGNPYVGTLAPSEDTLGKIYLVSNGAGYDEYITTDNSGYSWILLGTTNLDLSGYATASELQAVKDVLFGADDYVYNNSGESAYYNASGVARSNYGIGMVTPIIASSVKFNVVITPFIRGNHAYTMKYAIVESSTTGSMTPSSQTIIQSGTLALSKSFSQYVIRLATEHTTQLNRCIALLLYSDGSSTQMPEVKGSATNDQYNADTQRYLLLSTSGLYDPFSVSWSRASSGYYAPSPTIKFESDSLIQDVSDNKAAIAQLQSDISNPPYFRHEKSVNLFDYFSQDNKDGGYYNYNAVFTSAAGYRVSHPIPLKGGVTYKAVFGAGLGTSDVIAIVDANNNVLGKMNGTISGDYITITPTTDLYASFNCGNGTASKRYFMVCKDSEFPAEFVAYYDYVELTDAVVGDDAGGSRLIGKSVIFAGDSICAGTNDSYGGGYARRIGERNNMNWRNEAVGGATIIDKNLVGSTFTISDTDFGSGADYIILEGGTNDADRIGSILNGGNPQYYGSFGVTDYTTEFDNATFCSAVERLLQRVISGFPSAHIGFIIAPKMGVTSQGYTKDTNNRRAYFETIIEICHKWGVPVLNLWDECTMNPRIASHYTSGQDYLYADGQHPTANGYDLMTPIIEEWMKSI